MRYFLVDYENVNWAGLYGISFLTEDDTVLIFYSDHADTVNFTTLDYIMRSKALIKRHRITKFGNNALDFQLSTYVGYLLGTHTEGEVYIISKDQGYLSVLDFCRERLSSSGIKVEMYNSINALLLKDRSRSRTSANTSDNPAEPVISKLELEPLNETMIAAPPTEPIFKAAFADAAKAAAEQKRPEVLVKIMGKKPEPVEKVGQGNAEENSSLKIQMKVEDLIEKIAPKNTQSEAVRVEKAESDGIRKTPAAVKIMADDLTENISAKPARAVQEKPEARVEIKPESKKPAAAVAVAEKPEIKAEAKAEAKTESKKPASAVAVAEKPEIKTEAKAEAKTESKKSAVAVVVAEKPEAKLTEKPAQEKKNEKKKIAKPKAETPAVKKSAEAPKANKAAAQKKVEEAALPDTPATIDYLKLRVAVSVSKIESLVDADELVRDEICEKITGFVLAAENKQAFYLSFTKTFGQKQGVEYFNVIKKDFPLFKAISDAIKKA